MSARRSGLLLLGALSLTPTARAQPAATSLAAPPPAPAPPDRTPASVTPPPSPELPYTSPPPVAAAPPAAPPPVLSLVCPPIAPYLYAPPGLAPVCVSIPWTPAAAPPPPASKPASTPEPAPEPLGAWRRRPWELRLRAGLFSPWGLLGASLDFAFLPRFSLEVGAGVGVFGLNADAMAHLRLTSADSWALSVGAGASMGRFSTQGNIPGADYDGRTWNTAAWGNLEAALDWRFETHATLGMRAGVGTILNASAAGPCRSEQDCEGGTTFPYLGLSLGYSLEL